MQGKLHRPMSLRYAPSGLDNNSSNRSQGSQSVRHTPFLPPINSPMLGSPRPRHSTPNSSLMPLSRAAFSAASPIESEHRPLKVHNILNPMSELASDQTRSRSSSQYDFSRGHGGPGSAPPYLAPLLQPSAQGYYGQVGPGNASQMPSMPQITVGPDSPYGPISGSMGSGTYHIMTFDTENGPIQVPVDVQAASKMADDKRKRNAGASARFRQRRKEKEKESSDKIASLENQIREIAKQKEYYRGERDYFRELAYNSSASNQITPRMPSPRPRKTSQPIVPKTPTDHDWQQVSQRDLDRPMLSPATVGQNRPYNPGPPSQPPFEHTWNRP
jgi:hypothetical protein